MQLSPRLWSLGSDASWEIIHFRPVALDSGYNRSPARGLAVKLPLQGFLFFVPITIAVADGGAVQLACDQVPAGQSKTRMLG